MEAYLRASWAGIPGNVELVNRAAELDDLPDARFRRSRPTQCRSSSESSHACRTLRGIRPIFDRASPDLRSQVEPENDSTATNLHANRPAGFALPYLERRARSQAFIADIAKNGCLVLDDLRYAHDL